ncbi:hypothetical protein [Pseudomaricurvus sp.]|uniref:hypothetical protein n=1 Tax=Pseudomaricurvus sp. TaxID=2004510 RepID=UPI003F6A7826
MTRFGILLLLLIAGLSHADDGTIRGKVIAVSGDDVGIRLTLDSGLPPECQTSSGSEILVKPTYPGVFHLAQSSLGINVEIQADYEPLQRECVAKEITLKATP